MTHLSLCSGIGGIDLAAEWAGFRTVGQCECAEYPLQILARHWPDVPRWEDIHHVTAETVYSHTGLRTVDLLSGGIPCQPFSVAGKQKGKGDTRYLWPEMLRIIRELAPGWVLVENVPGILRLAADNIIADLEQAGYSVGVFHYEAAAVGALHRRARVFFVAHAAGIHSNTWRAEPERQQRQAGPANGCCTMAHADKQGLQGRNGTGVPECPGEPPAGQGGASVADPHGSGFRWDDRRQNDLQPEIGGWWQAEPAVGRVAHGIPQRVDKLIALGNAVVPQQVYPLVRAIAITEYWNRYDNKEVSYWL